jgi:glucose/arabinose dehydrogenase
MIALSSGLVAEQSLIDGELIFMNRCAVCHGANLEGRLAKSLVDGVWQFGGKSSYARRIVAYGIPDLGMPPFVDVLSKDEIEAVVEYVKAREEAVGAVRPETPDVVYAREYTMRVEVLTEDLEIPWSIDFLDDKTFLITERPGRLRVFRDGRLQSAPVSGTPVVLHSGQGGLLDVAVGPEYAEKGWIYLAYSHSFEPASEAEERPPAMTRIVRGRLNDNAWVDEQLIFEAPPETYRSSGSHFGSRIVFDPSGFLFFSIGDRGKSENAQDLSRPNGKVHRIRTDGSVPSDNPFVHQDDALPTIFSYGHRNPQGLAVHPRTGRVWDTEHGPFGGDELNLIAAGRNYGWPVITYGRDYDGTIISDFTQWPGMEQPIMYWNPSIAVCGLDFYRGNLFPKWQGRLLAGALKYEQVELLDIKENRVLHRQVILKNLGRVRDVASGPDGAIYVVLNGPDMVVRLTPKESPL